MEGILGGCHRTAVALCVHCSQAKSDKQVAKEMLIRRKRFAADKGTGGTTAPFFQQVVGESGLVGKYTLDGIHRFNTVKASGESGQICMCLHTARPGGALCD